MNFIRSAWEQRPGVEDTLLIGGSVAIGVGSGWGWGWHIGLMVFGGIMLFIALTPIEKVIHVDSD